MLMLPFKMLSIEPQALHLPRAGPGAEGTSNLPNTGPNTAQELTQPAAWWTPCTCSLLTILHPNDFSWKSIQGHKWKEHKNWPPPSQFCPVDIIVVAMTLIWVSHILYTGIKTSHTPPKHIKFFWCCKTAVATASRLMAKTLYWPCAPWDMPVIAHMGHPWG